MIEISNITKKYGKHYALKQVSFNIKRNTCLGLLGQNGAGKTTLMDILCGCNKPDAGNIYINNSSLSSNADAYKSLISYVPELPPLYMDMTVLEYLHFVAELKSIIKSDRKTHIAEILELCSLQSVQNRLIGNLSKGYRQRVGIAQALVGNAEILVLDEPTVGLDPKQIHEILQLIKKLSQNRTIIISSHRLYEIQEVCSQYLILHKGEIKHSGDLQTTNKNQVRLEILIDIQDKAILDTLRELSFVKKCTSTTKQSHTGKLLSITLDCEKETLPEKAINILLQSNNVLLYGLRRLQEDIESIFLELTKE